MIHCPADVLALWSVFPELEVCDLGFGLPVEVQFYLNQGTIAQSSGLQFISLSVALYCR
jgi:hypothetical protein